MGAAIANQYRSQGGFGKAHGHSGMRRRRIGGGQFARTELRREQISEQILPETRSSGRRYAATGLTVASNYSPFASAGTGKPRLRMRAAIPGSRPRNFL